MNNNKLKVNDSFKIDSEDMLNVINVDLKDYDLHKVIDNQLKQTITIYVPNNENKQVIAVIDNIVIATGFYDCEDLSEDSDYLPVIYNNKPYCYFDYYYASMTHYYPNK